MFRVGRLNGKIGIIDVKHKKFVYCPPQFIFLISRQELQFLLDELNNTGKISIDSIMRFESNAKRR